MIVVAFLVGIVASLIIGFLAGTWSSYQFALRKADKYLHRPEWMYGPYKTDNDANWFHAGYRRGWNAGIRKLVDAFKEGNS